MTVLAATAWRSNSELIEACAQLGYLHEDWRTIDLTYGRANFWQLWRPTRLVSNDIDRDSLALWHEDFRSTGWDSAHFDAVVFDPPYKLNGAPSYARYGVNNRATIAQRHGLMLDGLMEAARITKPGGYVLAKCQDQVASGRVWWQTDMLTEEGAHHGLQKVDALHLLAYRPQPPGRRQVHARRNYSTLLVFRKLG